jgi:hypothetical protein
MRHPDPQRSLMAGYLEQMALLRGAIEDSYQIALTSGRLQGDDHAITKSILLSVKAYYDSRYAVCDFLDKRNVGHGADYMVEAILFHLKTFLASRQSPLEVSGERSLPKPTRARPDISVWLGDRPVAVIECKTTLGWNRTDWEDSFLKRQERICSALPDVKCYLLIFAGQDAPRVAQSQHFGRQYFVLSREWPHKIHKDDPSQDIVTPIEPLFLEIERMGEVPVRVASNEEQVT